MVFEEILDNKSKVTDENNNEIVDLTDSNLKTSEFSYISSTIISNEMQMRPDKLSYVIFGMTSDIGRLLKANHISNPFSICSGDLMLIPDMFSISSQIDSITGEEKEMAAKIRAQYIDPSKQTDTSATSSAIEEYLNRKKIGLPPNIMKEGDQEMRIEGGRVVYGPDATRGKSSTSNEDYLKKLTNE